MNERMTGIILTYTVDGNHARDNAGAEVPATKTTKISARCAAILENGRDGEGPQGGGLKKGTPVWE